jgi:hypothetical protein
MASVEALYENYELLQNAKNPSEHPAAFKEILAASKGDAKQRQLACQFIVKFVKSFSEFQEQAIEAHIDLCEDEEPLIRRYAIKELPSFCKDGSENVSKIAFILAQLMETEDTVELQVVYSSLLQLLKKSPKECLTGVFDHLKSETSSDSARARNCNFLIAKLSLLSDAQLNIEVEKYIAEQAREAMKTADVPTFAGLLGILSSLKSMQRLTARQQLIESIGDKAGIKNSAFSEDAITSFYLCTSQALNLFSKNVGSTTYFSCLCEKVLPAYMKFAAKAKTEASTLPSKLQMFKLLAELATHSGADVPLVALQHLFQTLLDLMPSPPEQVSDEDFKNYPNLELALVECVIYAFHSVAANHTDFFTAPEAAARLADFRKRLQYFALGLKVYTKKLNDDLSKKTKAELLTDEMKIKSDALNICNNLNAIIRDLFRNPPQYLAKVTLSWKKADAPPAEPKPAVALKRPSTEKEVNGDGRGGKSQRPLYRPPGGRYSTNVQFDGGNRLGVRGGRGGTRGGSRGATRDTRY